MIKSMKVLALFLCVILFAACSMEEMAQKLVPETVMADAEATVDAVMAKDKAFLKPLKGENQSDGAFENILEQVFTEVSTGIEIRRDIVGATSNINISNSDGKTRTIETIYEVETEDGFTLISLNYLQSRTETTCCRLVGLHVEYYETSPIRASLEMIAKVGKIVGIVILLAIMALIAFLLRRRNKKNAVQDPY